jgi:hypothetical protein
VGSPAKSHGAAEHAFKTEPLAEDPARREPVLSKVPREEPEQFSPAAVSEEPKASSGIPAQAPTRVPSAAWAVLGLVLVCALGLFVSTAWEPRPAVVEQPQVAIAPAQGAADKPETADTSIVPDDMPARSPADDQVPLPSVKDEVPRRPASSRAMKPADAQVSAAPVATVYINVHSESERASARRLAQPLARRGIRVAGVRVVQGGPDTADLQYFRPEEAAAAARVAKTLREIGLPAPRLTRVRGLESRAMPQQYELWLPAGVEKHGR